MKGASDDYIAKEDAAQKQPAELYHFWCGSSHWYYTTLDDNFLYNGTWYTPIAIKRGVARYNIELEISEIDITIGNIAHPIVQYISQNPLDTVWVDIRRIFWDGTEGELVEATSIFVGEIRSVSFQGTNASAHCVGFENYLKRSIPIHRYQPQCNWEVFDSKCGLSDSGFKLSDISVTVDETKTLLTASDFGTEDDGYWVFGYIQYGNHRRMIIRHEGNGIRIRYPLTEMPATGGLVDIWPGCDGNVETCRDKFSNVNGFLGFPYMPFDNPVTWS